MDAPPPWLVTVAVPAAGLAVAAVAGLRMAADCVMVAWLVGFCGLLREKGESVSEIG
jgi:hypothetical protein